ncbi:WbuC family cupin fold metalloprotein [Bacteroides bouchesdurhonensis]|uniref:WbuC family cupin fold metalloprotein n=1 Tax=Bacteroides bouchesdurhonensis TaxID=1841855 RepID=UPI00097F81D7|nr:WbuC family cupin fold metalloprotein [Bacteroides bouchesdurhonensis]
MKINKQLFDTLLSQAADSVRLRQNYDLRTSSEDQSQRMLNAVLPGTQVPIHRHQKTTECVFILKGKIEEILYNDKGVEYERYYLDANSDCRGCVVPKGVWHTIVVREPSVIFEAKDGVFKPLTSDDVWNYE